MCKPKGIYICVHVVFSHIFLNSLFLSCNIDFNIALILTVSTKGKPAI